MTTGQDDIMYQFMGGLMRRNEQLKVVADDRKGFVTLRITKKPQGQGGEVVVEWQQRQGNKAIGEVNTLAVSTAAVPLKISLREKARVIKLVQGDLAPVYIWLQNADVSSDQDVLLHFQNFLNRAGLDQNEDQEMTGVDKGGTDAKPASQEQSDSAGQPQLTIDMRPPRKPRDREGAQEQPQNSSVGVSPGGDASAATAEQLQKKELIAQLVRSLLQGSPQQQQDPGPGLTLVLQPAAVEKLFDDPAIVERLAPYLPEEHRGSAEKLRELVHSPQFYEQLAHLSMLLQTGEVNMTHFGLPFKGVTVESFIESIQESVSQNQPDAMDEDTESKPDA